MAEQMQMRNRQPQHQYRTKLVRRRQPHRQDQHQRDHPQNDLPGHARPQPQGGLAHAAVLIVSAHTPDIPKCQPDQKISHKPMVKLHGQVIFKEIEIGRLLRQQAGRDEIAIHGRPIIIGHAGINTGDQCAH